MSLIVSELHAPRASRAANTAVVPARVRIDGFIIARIWMRYHPIGIPHVGKPDCPLSQLTLMSLPAPIAGSPPPAMR